jgi:rhamnose utilization protein RhaD (predicted bifunctional aldolase and dehydrogenase)
MTAFTTRDFVPLAESTFAWLLDRGFTLTEASAETLYASVLFTNETTHVRVALDIHDRSLDISAGPAAGAGAPSGALLPDGTRAQFPLWLLLWVKTADETRARSLSEYSEESEAGLRTALEANSLALKEAAADVLAGDFSIFARAELADRARIEANIARRAWPSPPP